MKELISEDKEIFIMAMQHMEDKHFENSIVAYKEDRTVYILAYDSENKLYGFQSCYYLLSTVKHLMTVDRYWVAESPSTSVRMSINGGNKVYLFNGFKDFIKFLNM